MVKEYKASFLPTFIQAYGAMLLLIVVTEGFSIKTGPLIFGSIIIFFGVVGLILFTKVTVSENGILGFDIFGGHHFVTWGEMRRVNRMGIYYMSYFLLHHSAHGLTLWIPRFLVNYQDFRNTVLELAPKDNVLKIFLENN